MYFWSIKQLLQRSYFAFQSVSVTTCEICAYAEDWPTLLLLQSLSTRNKGLTFHFVRRQHNILVTQVYITGSIIFRIIKIPIKLSTYTEIIKIHKGNSFQQNLLYKILRNNTTCNFLTTNAVKIAVWKLWLISHRILLFSIYLEYLLRVYQQLLLSYPFQIAELRENSFS
jgi:hypothetical protein